ncbi:MAG TPA: GTP pyrophosphokinase family protein [Candidatus Scatomonas pullistercoris]|uniref:GTP pyrophosphokinase family protein n=1 Tax=Candidatus Scatomonas pullistercoris TaxID=2840920 RepID=A0A9D1P464_9FIRM|nr:GTP pyrophosphokinase family protein [Candidatus Scatomonas pullistercoris]
MDILLWHKLLEPYELAVQELVLKFQHMKKEFQDRGLYCPIEHVSGRVKTVNSILDKMKKKGIPMDQMEELIEDIAGVRITCQFVEDIEKVAQLIEERSDIEVQYEKDYVKHMKESGYRSYHLIIFYTVQTLEGPKKIQMEIQIRTLAMDFWATVEHSLQYKYKTNIPEHIRQRLSNAADAIIALDNEMSSVRNEIMDAQLSSQLQHRMVADILTAIENLYRITSRREVEKIQEEFYRIYALNDMDELKRFHTELDQIAEGYRAQSVTAGL